MKRTGQPLLETRKGEPAPGTRLGVFEITTQIGEGGMGAVYRATDTSLNRQVAIKVLPDAFAEDAERLARFEREAKTLAAPPSKARSRWLLIATRCV